VLREIVLDTETTGLDPVEGHRIIEIGLVELVDHFPTGNAKQFYLNPERPVPPDSQLVHGITDQFLADKPLFEAIVDEMLAFLGDAPLVIHNASFDIKFLNFELNRVGRPLLPYGRAIDTIEIAKARIPGARYSLDELCRRFDIDLSARARHGALLDAELTAQVYLELIGGRQKRLSLAPGDEDSIVVGLEIRPARPRPEPLPSRLTAEEAVAHAAFVASELGANALWNQAA
jgi:DNA polymerase-3 subunit epsilon